MSTVLNRWWRGREEKIAIDVQASRLIVLNQAVGASLPPKALNIPFVGASFSTLSNESPSGVERVRDLLMTNLAETNFRYAQLGVSLPSESTFIARHPDVFRRPFSEFERVQEWAFRFLSLNQEEHRTRIIPYPVGGDREGCLIAASKRAAVEFWEMVADALKVDLVLVAPRVSSLIRYALHAGTEGEQRSSVWIDMIERPPYVHRFDGVVPVESTVMSDTTRCRELVRGYLKGATSPHEKIPNEKDVSVWCLLAEGQSLEEAAHAMRLGAWWPSTTQWIKDETIAALGALLLMEDR